MTTTKITILSTMIASTTTTSSDPPPAVPLPSPRIEGTMTIDFVRLFKEEKRRLRRAQRPTNPLENSEAEPKESRDTVPDAAITPPWNYDASLLLLDSSATPPPLLPLQCPKLGHDCLFYQQHFLPPSFHDALYHWLWNELPERPYEATTTHPPHSSSGGAFWITLPHAQRRVALLTPPFPTPLLQLLHYLQQSEALPPSMPEINHILLNHYPSPAHGILPHTDGPAYAPYTVTVSLGPSAVLLRFSENGANHEARATVLLHGRGSCVRFQDAAYTRARHAIAAKVDEEITDADCANAPAGETVVRQAHRISITLRHYYGTRDDE